MEVDTIVDELIKIANIVWNNKENYQRIWNSIFKYAIAGIPFYTCCWKKPNKDNKYLLSLFVFFPTTCIS